jgi:hypothetical protein
MSTQEKERRSSSHGVGGEVAFPFNLEIVASLWQYVFSFAKQK